MNLRKFIFPLIIGSIIFFGCGSPAAFATPTLPPPTPTLTRTLQPTPAPTLTPTPILAAYPWKHVWIKLTATSPLNAANQFGLSEEPLFVIYTDGQVIAADAKKSSVRTRYLNTNQVCSLVGYFEELGVYKLEDLPATDETNPIYDFGSNFTPIDDGRIVTLTINMTSPHQVSFFEPYRKFLRWPLRKAVDYLETYNPGGFTPYQPDRLILFVHVGRDETADAKAKPQPWDLDSPVLSELTDKPYTLLEGQPAADVYKLLTSSQSKVFLEDDIEYTLASRLLYPHEIVNTGNAPIAVPTDSLFPVNCDP